MRNNDNIIFIDYKGVSHNARVQSFREHRDAQGALIHQEPLVTLNYNGGPGGEPLTLIDVPHISHPSRQENNPDLPSYPLHAWKHDEEEHRELPEDHPVHDHFNEQPQKDEQGNIIPKKRPHYEAHIQEHRAARGLETEFTTAGIIPPKPLPVGTGPKPPVGAVNDARVSESGNLPVGNHAVQDIRVVLPLGHPAHPETVKFPFECASCGVSVTRTASHHGGKQWEFRPLRVSELEADTSDPGKKVWVEHVCDPDIANMFRKKIEDAKKPAVVEPSAAERLAAGEQLSPEVKPPETEEGIEIVEPSASERMSPDAYFAPPKEPDVIAELEKAPPAPSETEKPEDAA